MFLNNYDFYDLHAFITFFRNNPKKTAYFPAVEKIIEYINQPQINNSIGMNTIRKIVNPYIKNDEEQLSWVFVENAYTANLCIIKNEAHYKILSVVLGEIILSIDDSERVYMLCDATHNIPELLVDVKKPKKAIISMIKNYRKQYHQKFLYDELKLL